MQEPNEHFNKNIQTLFKFDTEYYADSVEWCPHEPHKNKFTCANYQLTEPNDSNEKKRFGRILLFSISFNDGLQLLHVINTSGVLDQKWCPNLFNNDPLLGIVNSESTIEIYKLFNSTLTLFCHYKIECNVENLILSLDWSNDSNVVCSDSQGQVHLLNLNNNELVKKSSWKNHEFEAWISAFYYHDPNIFFSGGDDCLFFKYDKRVKQYVAKNKSHGAGVTSMHSNKSREHVLATGSYDENVYLWDVRNIKTETSKLKLPGTLWRLKYDPVHQKYLLAACMSGGVHVVFEEKIIASYNEHQSLSYGADWSYLNRKDCEFITEDNEFIIGTCSFYDHLLCVGKINFDL